jgi:hypothetical protein
LVSPTNVVVVGGLAIAGVGYDKYLRFMWPLLPALFVVAVGALALAAGLTWAETPGRSPIADSPAPFIRTVGRVHGLADQSLHPAVSLSSSIDQPQSLPRVQPSV